MKYFKKKFKIKISHFYEDDYLVQYSEHYIIPTWNVISYYNTDGVQRVCSKFKIEDAENIATTIKCMDDLIACNYLI